MKMALALASTQRQAIKLTYQGMAVDELVEIWNKGIPDELKASCEFLPNLSLDDCNAILGLSGEPLRLALSVHGVVYI